MKEESLRILRPTAAWIVIVLFALHLVATTPYFLSALQPLSSDPISYDDKMRIKWEGYYNLMHFIAQETPEHSVILMDNTARVYMDVYFLYPRTLLYGEAETFRTHPEIQYVVATEDFPDFPVTGEKRMMNDKLGLYKILR